MVDPIADMFNRIRNAQAVRLPAVDLPFSNLKYEIAKILGKSGFIEKVERKKKRIKKTSQNRQQSWLKPALEITLKYENKIPAISGLKKISKPGQRIYTSWQKIKRVKSGYGLSVISTAKGLMTNKEARKNKIGGEIICEIW